MLPYLYLSIGVFASSVVFTFISLRLIRRFGFTQIEREEGPDSHKKKTGTPTMGGIGFVLIILIFGFIFIDPRYIPSLILFISFAVIGFMDDIIKILNVRNLGLTFWQKIILQVVISSGFALYMINFFPQKNLFLIEAITPVVYFLFLVFLIIGTSNATNLTDGLDGLLAGTSILSFTALTLIFIKSHLYGGAAFSIIIIFAILGFLPFNFPKAKIFMGDVGSLGIGALLAALAITNIKEFMLIPLGFIFIIEALSVIIQVFYFKAYKKKLFKMAPLHHHFELSGIKENYVTLIFWLIQAIACTIGVFLA